MVGASVTLVTLVTHPKEWGCLQNGYDKLWNVTRTQVS
jgi:hypothetical protein